MNRPDTLSLQRDAFATLRGATHVRVTHGSLWLTVDGETSDVFIECGQGLALPAGAKVLVQAMHAPARVLVVRPASWRERASAVWHALRPSPAGAHR